MPILSLDEFEEMANRLYDRIPSRLLQQLNGGIIIEEEACQRDPELPDVYIMGEYVDDPYGMGRFIVLYYGSFRALLAEEPAEIWEAELWETLVHEIRHHVESLAGEDALEQEDWEELRRMYEEARASGDEGEGDGAGPQGPEVQ